MLVQMGKKMVLTILLTLFISSLVFNFQSVKTDFSSVISPEYPLVQSWNLTFPFSPGPDCARDVAVDSEDNIIVVGFDEYPGSYEWRIIKLRSNGTEVWNRLYDFSDYEDVANGVAVDSEDNIYVVGYDHCPGLADSQWRIIKLDKDGNYLKNYTINPADTGVYKTDGAKSVAVDSTNNNIYVAGYDSSLGHVQWRIMKFDLNLGPIGEPYTTDFSSTAASAYDIAIYSNNIYVAGYDIGLDPGNLDAKWRISKFNQNLTVIRGYITDPSDEEDKPLSVAVDTDGNVYVVGYDRSLSDSDSWRVHKLDNNLYDVWLFSLQNPYNERAEGVAVDTHDNIIIVGTDRSLGYDRWKIIKLDKDKNPIWEEEYILGDFEGVPYAVATDSNDDIIVVGSDTEETQQQWRIMKFTPFVPPAPSLSLTPDSGFSSCTVSGCGYAPNSEVMMMWGGTDLLTIPASPKTDFWGNFTAIITVPSQNQPGNYTIQAVDEYGIKANATFTVIDMKGDPGEQGSEALVGYFAVACILAIVAICLATYSLLKKTKP